MPPFKTLDFHSLPIRAGDTLRVTSWNLISTEDILVIGRSVLENGDIIEFERTISPNSSVAGVTVDIQMTPGRLVSLAAWNLIAGSPAGKTYVYATLFRGKPDTGAPFYPVLAGYLGSDAPLSWPYNGHRVLKDAVPFSTIQTLGSSAVGAGYNYAAGTTAYHLLQAVQFNLVTDATAGDRWPYVEIVLGGTTYARVITQNPVGASQNFQYNFVRNALEVGLTAHNSVVSRLMELDPMSNISVVVNAFNLQAGDQFQTGRLRFDRWAQAQSSITA